MHPYLQAALGLCALVVSVGGLVVAFTRRNTRTEMTAEQLVGAPTQLARLEMRLDQIARDQGDHRVEGATRSAKLDVQVGELAKGMHAIERVVDAAIPQLTRIDKRVADIEDEQDASTKEATSKRHELRNRVQEHGLRIEVLEREQAKMHQKLSSTYPRVEQRITEPTPPRKGGG